VARAAGPVKELPSPKIPGHSPPFTPRAMQILERAPLEATSLGSDRVASEHVLLALVDDHEGIAARILREYGVDTERVREEVIRRLSDSGR
jgi:ATP-dependent Clp protease ATP-binding subunit ClpC